MATIRERARWLEKALNPDWAFWSRHREDDGVSRDEYDYSDNSSNDDDASNDDKSSSHENLTSDHDASNEDNSSSDNYASNDDAESEEVYSQNDSVYDERQFRKDENDDVEVESTHSAIDLGISRTKCGENEENNSEIEEIHSASDTNSSSIGSDEAGRNDIESKESNSLEGMDLDLRNFGAVSKRGYKGDDIVVSKCPTCHSLKPEPPAALTLAIPFEPSTLKHKSQSNTECPTCPVIEEALSHMLSYWRTCLYFNSDLREARIQSVLGGLNLEGRARIDLGGGCCYLIRATEMKLFIDKGKPLPRAALLDCFLAPMDNGITRRYTLAKAWLDECLTIHDDCRHTGSFPLLPRRVIDLRDFLDLGRLVLIETYGMQGNYACLSYCWGPNNNFVTSEKNIKNMMLNIPWADLPQTYKDAVSVTSGLGIPFLWIDALCIIQGHKQDWAEQSASMSSIYGGAILTITAANCTSAADGFLDKCGIRGNLLEIPYVPDQGQNESIIYARREYDHFGFETFQETLIKPSFQNPLRNRAWCFQEHFLSKRLLHFGHDEMFFECNNGLRCECGGCDGRGGMKADFAEWLNDRSKSSPSKMSWNILAKEFSARKITYIADKLPALSGIARLCQNRTRSTYLAGHWDDANFLAGLTWRVFDTLQGCASSELPRYWAPSWSWVSINRCDQVIWSHYSHSSLDTKNQGTRILAKKTYLATDDLTGAVDGGYIIVQGFCLDALLLREVNVLGSCDARIERFGIDSSNSTLDLDRALEPYKEKNVICWYIGEHYGYYDMMVLEKIVNRTYRRIGWLSIDGNNSHEQGFQARCEAFLGNYKKCLRGFAIV